MLLYIHVYCSGRGINIPTGRHRLGPTSAAQYPLHVGVVASVITGLKKRCWPEKLRSCNARLPPAAGYGKYSWRKRLRFNQRKKVASWQPLDLGSDHKLQIILSFKAQMVTRALLDLLLIKTHVRKLRGYISIPRLDFTMLLNKIE